MSNEQSPSWEQIVDWIDGRLSAIEAQTIAEQLARSHEAAADAMWLHAFKRASSDVVLDEPPQDLRLALRASFDDYANRQLHSHTTITDLMARLVATLSFDSGTEFGLAGARAGASPSMRQLLYSTDAADISLTIQEKEEQLRVNGQILPLTDIAPDTFQAYLQREDETIAQVPVDALGQFTLSEIMPDTYQLTLNHASLIIIIEAVDFQL